jgi:hypothetical protein
VGQDSHFETSIQRTRPIAVENLRGLFKQSWQML